MLEKCFYIMVLFSLFSCRQSSEMATFNSDEIRLEVLQMFDDYHEAIKQQGLTGEFDFFDQSESFFWVVEGYTSPLSRDTIETILTANAQAFNTVDFHWDTLTIYPLSTSIASFTGKVGGTMVDTSGNSSSVSIIESGIVVKRDEKWKLLSGQSANLPIDN